jgi:hypothetical protein
MVYTGQFNENISEVIKEWKNNTVVSFRTMIKLKGNGNEFLYI